MKEVNISYYQQLLDKGRYNPSDRNFYQKVLDSIKKQGGKATDRQYNIIQQIKFGKTMYSSKNEHIYNKTMNQTTQLRQLIKESIQEYIREVEASGNIAAQEAKVRACEEAIALREKKANLEGIDETMHEMIDGAKINELKKEIKELQKYKSKAEKVLDKMKMKSEGKTTKKMEDEGMEEGTVDEVNLDEYTDDPASGPQLEENVDKEMYYEKAKQLKNDGLDYDETVERLEDMGVDNRSAEIIAMNVFKEEMYEMLLMQKRAGIITETEYKAKIEEVSSSKKVQMLLNRLRELIPDQEGEFLEFMAKTTNSGMDYTGVDDFQLAQNFIDFEEDENDEEFTSQVMNDVLGTYIPAFESGDGIFEAKKMTAAQKDKKEDIVKGMKKSKSFGKSKDEKSKMYATATKLATKKLKA